MWFFTRPETFDIGNGFKAETKDYNFFVTHNLVGNGLLHFINASADLLKENNENVSKKELAALRRTLNKVVYDSERGEFYHHLVRSYGKDAITHNAWIYLSWESHWPVCLEVFTDMPTKVIENYGAEQWKWRVESCPDEELRQLMEAISKRTDMYGGVNNDTIRTLF